MTTPHPFAALVRRLDAEASAAPWFGGHLSMTDDGCDCTYVLNEHQMGDVATFAVRKDGDPHGSEYPTKVECIANMAMTRTLRNAAPEVAALVEAAGLACDCWFGQGCETETVIRMDKVRAALDALRVVATQAKEAT